MHHSLQSAEGLRSSRLQPHATFPNESSNFTWPVWAVNHIPSLIATLSDESKFWNINGFFEFFSVLLLAGSGARPTPNNRIDKRPERRRRLIAD
jgi:hypothetical protein